jgi:antitoxin (DNA-binding transcriptional repressor) of toxin-antitoxin stability system
MITVNMHEAKSRLSELVNALHEKGETIVLCRSGHPVAELVKPRTRRGKTAFNRLKPQPDLKPLSIKYDPTEPLNPDEWPDSLK